MRDIAFPAREQARQLHGDRRPTRHHTPGQDVL
ncbi:MAG: hypothetical protein ACD_62C00116G0001, partial [uncultured bacterium]